MHGLERVKVLGMTVVKLAAFFLDHLDIIAILVNANSTTAEWNGGTGGRADPGEWIKDGFAIETE